MSHKEFVGICAKAFSQFTSAPVPRAEYVKPRYTGPKQLLLLAGSVSVKGSVASTFPEGNEATSNGWGHRGFLSYVGQVLQHRLF